MGTPRRPKLREPEPPSKLRAKQQATLDWIHNCFRYRGITSGFVDALVKAYGAHGGGQALLSDAESYWKERAPRLRELAASARREHEALHELFGSLTAHFDLGREEPGGGGPCGSRRGAKKVRLDTMRGEPCDLDGECHAIAAEVRAHASYCRWLREEASEPAREVVTGAKVALEKAPQLRGKGTVVAFLLGRMRFQPRHVALLILVGEGAELPIDRDTLKAYAHRIVVAGRSTATVQATKKRSTRRVKTEERSPR